MSPMDTSEKGLETLICRALTGRDCFAGSEEPTQEEVHERCGTYAPGWVPGDPKDYNREFCVDLKKLYDFLLETQPKVVPALELEQDSPVRRAFLSRLQGEISKRGTIDVLRNGLKHGPLHVDLFYGTPSPGNSAAGDRFKANRFSVTRQLCYSRDETRRSLDLAMFINGLPVITFELKNSLTKQTVEDAIRQYQRDRDPREKLFEFGRCVVHFALDENEVHFCTQLKGKASWFLPFNKGYLDGAGNPPNPNGLKTDYLWKEVLTRKGLTEILENYAQVVSSKDEKTGKKKLSQIWPRYHQLDVVRKLLEDVRAWGVGKRYLIQHSAGSGKSNSIAWLAHQLIGVRRDEELVFDTVIVVTDRRILDEQLRATIGQFAQVGATIGAVTGGAGSKTAELRGYLEAEKRIIICTVQTFPFVLKQIGEEFAGRRFAVLIDEAHSSQGGKAAAALSATLSGYGTGEADEEENTEDKINRLMSGRKIPTNASYFAFTATPKHKTLEVFGTPDPQPDGRVRHLPFHSYTMKQAIQENFILDVLANYIPVQSYYHLIKRVEDDPEFDSKRAQKKLRRYVESHDHAIRLKAEIMVDHFHQQVVSHNKIGGQARAMVVCDGIKRALQYHDAISAYLVERKSPYQAVVAFSGEVEYGGKKVTEASVNGFPSNQIADKVCSDPYRFLVCADKFQTGYDEPLLHTMYVDKTLEGIKAVQTLSRLNRAHPKKHDTCVLDFMNDSETILKSFEPYYRTTILADETDPNKLHDLKYELDQAQVYTPEEVGQVVSLFLQSGKREELDPVLDVCVARYQQDLDEEGQVAFKSKAKAFCRTYAFLGSILPYPVRDWEVLSIFLGFLVSKLPAPIDQDLARGILDSIDMDSYRVEKQETLRITLPDEDAEIDPLPAGAAGRKAEPELDRLSNILKTFNDRFGNIPWTDADRIRRMITEELPNAVSKDEAYTNAMNQSDEQNARIELEAAAWRAATARMGDETEFFGQFSDNPAFRREVLDAVFQITYHARKAG